MGGFTSDQSCNFEKLKQSQNAASSDTGCTTSVGGSSDSSDALKNLAPRAVDPKDLKGLNYELSSQEDAEDLDDTENVSEYDDDDDYLYTDDYVGMQSQFENVDLPAGVEVSLPSLEGSATSSTSATPGAAESKIKAMATSHSNIQGNSDLDAKSEKIEEDQVMQKFQSFKQFDIVEDYSDHHFSRMGVSDVQSPKNWSKTIQDEWRLLEKDLPDTIYVRVYESRMELLRAVMIGPSGTPYHDGLFVFDCFFPTDYPDVPPNVYYYSGGLRLNPNLYNCGKVCLSLLGTWPGKQDEMWVPGKSTMLQVLVSIQALVLNAKPFYNEPGHEIFTGSVGERKSNEYNRKAFILSVKTMIYVLRRPPKHFGDFISGHFHKRAHNILSACRAYMEGAPVGSADTGVVQSNDAGKHSNGEFGLELGKVMNLLISSFTKNGSTHCEQYRVSA